jgi:hypothetical protein
MLQCVTRLTRVGKGGATERVPSRIAAVRQTQRRKRSQVVGDPSFATAAGACMAFEPGMPEAAKAALAADEKRSGALAAKPYPQGWFARFPVRKP